MARLFPPGAALIEFGSGSSKKVRILLAAARTIAAYVPVDISSRDARRRKRKSFAATIRASRCCRSKPTSRSPSRLPPATSGHGAYRILSRVDHRQFRAARSLRVPAPRRANARTRREPDHRRRSGEGREHPQCRLQRRSRRHREVQSQPARAHQSRARRQFRPCELQPPRFLQFRAPPHRDASRQQEAPEGAGWPDASSNSAPARRSTPRTATSTRSKPSPRWRAARDGRPIAAWTDAGANFSIHALAFEDR